MKPKPRISSMSKTNEFVSLSESLVEKRVDGEGVTEKQAHNWINTKKVEKELKEARAEIATLEKKQSELEAMNKSLMENPMRHANKAMTMPYYSMMNLSKSHDLNNSDDSVNDPEDEHRPPSTSINPGIPDGHNFQPLMIRPHFRMPSAPPIQTPDANFMHQSVDQRGDSSSPDSITGPNPSFQPRSFMHFPPAAHQQMMYQMHPLIIQQQQQFLKNFHPKAPGMSN